MFLVLNAELEVSGLPVSSELPSMPTLRDGLSGADLWPVAHRDHDLPLLWPWPRFAILMQSGARAFADEVGYVVVHEAFAPITRRAGGGLAGLKKHLMTVCPKKREKNRQPLKLACGKFYVKGPKRPVASIFFQTRRPKLRFF
ncbi:MAG: hypothetical protein U1F27_13590 [Turneriella sp.]